MSHAGRRQYPSWRLRAEVREHPGTIAERQRLADKRRDQRVADLEEALAKALDGETRANKRADSLADSLRALTGTTRGHAHGGARKGVE